MKPILIIAAALLAVHSMPPVALAQPGGQTDIQKQLENLQSIPPAQRQQLVQNLMENAQTMQKCMDEAGGKAALEELKELSDAHRQQISAMCAAGKRDQAQAYAQDASAELLKDERVAKLRQCSRIALQNMPQLSQLVETGGIDPTKHVCD